MEQRDTFFCGVGGSRAHHIEIESSDYDLLFIASDVPTRMSTHEYFEDTGYNVISSPPQWFFDRVYDTRYWAVWQYFYLLEYKSTNDFTAFIQENRDNFIHKNRQLLLAAYEEKIAKIKRSFSGFCIVNRKMVAYAFLFLYLLRDLPQGKAPIECFRPDGEIHDFLINVRHGEYSEEFLWDRFQALEAAKNHERAFYNTPRDEDFFRMVKSELDRYNFLPYEEWKKQQIQPH